MTNEQQLIWIKGYLHDKFTTEACAIKSFLANAENPPPSSVTQLTEAKMRYHTQDASAPPTLRCSMPQF